MADQPVLARFQNGMWFVTSLRGRLNPALFSILSGALSAVLVVPSGPAFAAAGDPIPEDTDISRFISEAGPQFLTNQGDLNSFFDWIREQPGIAESGYLGGINDVPNRSTKLMWKGDSALQQLAVAEGSRRGIAVTVQPRKYSLDELEDAAGKILDSADEPEWKGFKISSVTALGADFDGLEINGEYSAGALRSKASVSASKEAAAEVAVEKTDGVPFKINAKKTIDPWATRGSDTPPFNAGGYMVSASNPADTCSTGFSILMSSVRYTITARHCRAGDYKAKSGSARYGTTHAWSGDGGARVLTKPGSALMFDGAWNNASGYKKTVGGYGDVQVNDFVCTSGGNTGVHCNLKVTQLVEWWNDGHGRLSTIKAVQQTSGKIAGGPGDSGGPVLQPIANNKVRAVGMIQAGPANAACGSNSFGLTGNSCGTHVLFTGMRTIVNTLPNARLVTE